MWRFWLLVVLVLFPLAELALLLWLAAQTSWLAVLVWVIGTGVVGLWLIRSAGTRCLWDVRRQVAQRQLPGDRLVNGLLLLIAGAMLVLPGVLTDLVGLILWFPPTRHWVRRVAFFMLRARLLQGLNAAAKNNPPRDRIIDVKVIKKDPPHGGGASGRS